MTTQWEYLVVEDENPGWRIRPPGEKVSLSASSDGRMLTEVGGRGWELVIVTASSTKDGDRYIFKRPKAE